MAHHQHTNHDRMCSVQGMSSGRRSTTRSSLVTDEDDVAAELDEPPDAKQLFVKRTDSGGVSPPTADSHIMSPCQSKPSLLTQALLTSPELGASSDMDAPHLTSDGGLTSPTRTTTPSPPLPATNYPSLPRLSPHGTLSPSGKETSGNRRGAQGTEPENMPIDKVEESLGRRRCISFACGKRSSEQDTAAQKPKPAEPTSKAPAVAELPPRRPCLLKFACPTKPSKAETPKHTRPSHPSDAHRLPQGSQIDHKDNEALAQGHARPDAGESVAPAAKTTEQPIIGSVSDDHARMSTTSKVPRVFNRIDFQKSEATSFHAFAGSYYTEDEWTNEQTAYRRKMTIEDTLQKENAIRRLAEEAEEEAEEEEEGLDEDDEEEEEEEDYLDDVDADGTRSNDSADDGNESDNEEGFAESDDESEDGLGYHFWTPGLNTAATSTDHVEHIRPLKERVASDSSIESVVEVEGAKNRAPGPIGQHRYRSHTWKMSRRVAASANSDEFMIGTLDEDRPLQEAYLSSLEQRKRSKWKMIPQDIDPSFPTSDLEAEDDGNESEDGEDLEDTAAKASDSDEAAGQLGSQGGELTRSRHGVLGRSEKPSGPSPKRLHSPPPPRRLFGQSSHRLRSPPPANNKLASPPSSRRPSPLAKSPSSKTPRVDMPHLAQRPNLTHTASLPRIPNPFWKQHRATHVSQSPRGGTSSNATAASEAEYHTRGPIDIVQGLEKKRQRRKEKFWRIHCQKAHAGKEKGWRCQPGKGAERMREVGREMQDRFKGYGHFKNDVMLSV